MALKVAPLQVAPRPGNGILKISTDMSGPLLTLELSTFAPDMNTAPGEGSNDPVLQPGRQSSLTPGIAHSVKMALAGSHV